MKSGDALGDREAEPADASGGSLHWRVAYRLAGVKPARDLGG